MGIYLVGRVIKDTIVLIDRVSNVNEDLTNNLGDLVCGMFVCICLLGYNVRTD